MGVYLTGVHFVSVYLTAAHLIGVHLMGVYLMGVHLIGVYLMSVHLIVTFGGRWQCRISQFGAKCNLAVWRPYCPPHYARIVFRRSFSET